MSINLELLYGCIDYLENQFIHVVRISALLDQQIFQFYKALKQKASIMAIYIINVNIKMYIFDHLRMYIFAILPLDRYIFLSDKIFL